MTDATLQRAVEDALANKGTDEPQDPPPMISDRPRPPVTRAAEPQRPTQGDIDALSVLRNKEAFADAHVFVSRAIVRCGRDPGNPIPSDSDAIQEIYGILLDVQSARAPK